MTYTPQSQPPLSPQDERTWSVLIHVLGIFFSFLPALIGFLLFKDRGPFIRAHSVAALNFQITMAIAYAIGSILLVVIVGGLIIAAVGILTIVFSIIAAIAASRGEAYVYPLSIRFIR